MFISDTMFCRFKLSRKYINRYLGRQLVLRNRTCIQDFVSAKCCQKWRIIVKVISHALKGRWKKWEKNPWSLFILFTLLFSPGNSHGLELKQEEEEGGRILTCSRVLWVLCPLLRCNAFSNDLDSAVDLFVCLFAFWGLFFLAFSALIALLNARLLL